LTANGTKPILMEKNEVGEVKLKKKAEEWLPLHPSAKE
jgi:hypothetical protein